MKEKELHLHVSCLYHRNTMTEAFLIRFVFLIKEGVSSFTSSQVFQFRNTDTFNFLFHFSSLAHKAGKELDSRSLPTFFRRNTESCSFLFTESRMAGPFSKSYTEACMQSRETTLSSYIMSFFNSLFSNSP